MADPICRWRNSSIKQIMEFNTLFPLCNTNKKVARELVEKRWNILGGTDFFTTPYQLAAQMGVYYEDYQNMYPKFSKYISLEEAQQYMRNWGKKYYAPNPYTKSLQQTEKPIIINNFLVNWCLENEEARFSEALQAMFVESIGNTDILVNMLNNFSEVSIANDIMTLKENAPETPYDTVFLEIDKNDKKYFFDFVTLGFNSDFINVVKDLEKKLPLQTIFYGAPGTGKSNTIKREVEDKGRIHFRTTFHPDSDYSTFVGCYKPTMKLVKKTVVIGQDEKEVKPLPTGTDCVEQISYQFVPQAFTKAYCEAWNNYNPEGGSEPVFLIIEEINRGNCAQIFGDIFQLLDRKDGFSEYPIDADEDLKKFLLNGTKEDGTPWLVNKDGIKDGKLCLPPNLHIWATMNTSDQSLFPIDSAFKRRWDWEYVPIKRADKEPEKEWIIKVTHDGKTYWCYWWEFLEAINHQIEETTHSEDKQLGYFFAKPKAGENFISTDTFVNKVIFYLWNDVFKDEDSAVFQYDNDKVEDVSINCTGTMYFRHFMENKDEMIHYFINQLFAMGKDSTPAVPIDYLKNDADSKVAEHLPKMRELKVESPASGENSDEKSDDADSK